MRVNPRVLWAAGAALAVAATTGLNLPAASAGGPAGPAGIRTTDNTAQLYVYRVEANTAAAADRLSTGGFDLLEARSGRDLFVLGDAATAERLRSAGFRPTVDQTLAPTSWTPPSTRLVPGAERRLADPIDEVYNGGYRTVRAQHAHLDKVAVDKPELATVVDYGDSYLKTRNASTGYDLKAICLTKKKDGDCALTPDAPKPRFLLMTQIHAREIVTGDLAWRYIDHLVAGYGSDPEVTSLLDSTEVWVVPIVNPDGVDVVQQGGNRPYLQRKNLNTSAGGNCPNPPTAFSQGGVDLNRNAGFRWGGSGTSTSPCDQQYKGTSADSEPETKGIEELTRKLFKDQRGPGDADAAPRDTRGAMLTVHSYAGMHLYPWGFTTKDSPNEVGLRAIAAKMAGFTGYRYGQPGDILYNASGTSDDWSYGELGIASFTTELASCGTFTPAYSCASKEFASNLPTLSYLAKIASAPYQTSLGIDTRVWAGAQGAGSVPVNASLDGAAFGQPMEGATPARAQQVAAAEYTVDGGPARAMALSGSGSRVNAHAQVPTAGLTPGRHLVRVRARSGEGNWGPTSATWITVR